MNSRSPAHLRAKEFGLEYIKCKVSLKKKKTPKNLCCSAELDTVYIPAIISGYFSASPSLFVLEQGDIFSSAG